MIIRRASLEDVGNIAAIHVRSWQEGYRGLVPEEFLRSISIERRATIWREALEKQESDVWVAEDEGRVVGWITVGSSRDADADPATAELWAIYVDPAFWGRGAGRALWREAEAHLRSAKFERVTLWVFEENHRARRFYASHGFSVDPGPEQSWERGGVRLREIRLRRELQPRSCLR